MKNSKSIFPENEKQAFVHKFDLRDLDNEDSSNFFRMNYLERIHSIIGAVKDYSSGKRVLEIGCAQANISLLLAEEGFIAIALDIALEFLKYSRLKYERGKIAWICADGSLLPIQQNYFDVVILGEVIEHHTYPEELIEQIAICLKENGLLIITTPNHRALTNHLPSFSLFRGERNRLKSKQLGPAGEHHVFAFSKSEVISLIKNHRFKVLKVSFLNPIWLCRDLQFLYSRFPLFMLNALITFSEHLPFLKSKMCSCLMICAQKR